MIRKSEDISKNFCIMPWSGITTDPSGVIRPCCWMTMDQTFNGTVAEYKTSKYLQEIKDDFLNDRYPHGCRKCQWNDEHGFNSKRARENKRWEDSGNSWKDYADTKLTMVDLRLSNTCNLGCVMCGPRYSSYIYQEIKNSKYPVPDHWKNAIKENSNKSALYPFSENDIDEILSMMASNSWIYFTGGEPSLDKMVTKLLIKLIEKGYNKTILLQFNSNFQSISDDWIELLNEFKGRMCPSIDGTGDIAEYIRYPCDWKKVDGNVSRFIEKCGKNWETIITPTVSILSIFGLYDVFSWADKLKASYGENTRISVSVLNRLDYPKYFNICNLPFNAKNHAIEECQRIINDHPDLLTKLSTVDDIINHIKQQANSPFEKVVENLEKNDTMRGTNWRTSLPELAKFEKQ
jgi:MoaA/NifB/PqqE/SkfB family radical SAM enzyme